MNPADLARRNAIPLEVKKDGLQQRQNGDWVLRFVVQAADMDQNITRAAMGTRYQAVLVEIGDDELPIEQPEQVAEEPPKKQKMEWREVQPSAQAGIRCGEPVFWAFLREEYQFRVETADDAATAVRKVCGVNTRAALNTNRTARVMWQQLDQKYGAWKMAEQMA